MQVLSQKKQALGRRDRIEGDRIDDAMLPHAPREVSEVLDFPTAKVLVLERQVAKKMARKLQTEHLEHLEHLERKAQLMHAVHRSILMLRRSRAQPLPDFVAALLQGIPDPFDHCHGNVCVCVCVYVCMCVYVCVYVCVCVRVCV